MRDLCEESNFWFPDVYVCDDISGNPVYEAGFNWDDFSDANIELVSKKVYARFDESYRILKANNMDKYINGIFNYHESEGMREYIGNQVYKLLGI